MTNEQVDAFCKFLGTLPEEQRNKVFDRFIQEFEKVALVDLMMTLTRIFLGVDGKRESQEQRVGNGLR